jgi:uncharacterized damage-inducible protein DinB
MVNVPLDIVPYWSRLNDGIIRLVDYIPDDKLNWSPQPGLWNSKGILIHIISVRHSWLARDVQDGQETPDVLREAQTKDAIKQHLGVSWQRVERFLSNREQLAATYTGDDPNDPRTYDGHWIAFHLLEHDLHHRSDIFHYLALLGVEHPEVGTP